MRNRTPASSSASLRPRLERSAKTNSVKGKISQARFDVKYIDFVTRLIYLVISVNSWLTDFTTLRIGDEIN